MEQNSTSNNGVTRTQRKIEARDRSVAVLLVIAAAIIMINCVGIMSVTKHQKGEHKAKETENKIKIDSI